jgi:cobalt-zinc-cadmium efflux system outer membrane protein
MKTTYLLLLSATLIWLTEATPSLVRAEGDVATGNFSLADVTNTALAKNSAIQAASKRWSAAKQRITQAGAWDDPRISAKSRAARYVDVPPNAFTDQTLSIEQSIPISGKNRLRARIAAADVNIMFEELRRRELDVITKTRTSYFRLADAHAQLALNQRNVTSLQQIAEVSRSKYEVGTQGASDVLTAQNEANKLLETRQDILRQVSDAQSQLNVVMNRDAFAPLGQPDDVAMGRMPPPLTRLRTLILERRPEVQIARAKADAAKSKVELARRDWIPDPSIVVEGQRYNDSRQAASELDAGVSITVPWGNARKYSAVVREAKEELAAAEEELTQAQNEAMGLLRAALQKVETMHHHVDLFREKLVPQGRQAFEAAQFSYETGKTTFADWISAQRNLRDLEAEARMHLADYQTALAEMESVVGADLNLFPSGHSENENHQHK